MAKRILVPLDRHDGAETVLPLVADLARGAGATVRLLHVAPYPRTRIDPTGRVLIYAEQIMDRGRAEGEDYLRAASAPLDGVPVEQRVRFGDTAEEILLEADAFGADLIALAARASRWWRPESLRALPRRVAKKSPVPVMLLTSRSS